MRLRIHYAAANDELVSLINEGYKSINQIQNVYKRRKSSGSYDDKKDVPEIAQPIEKWAEKVSSALERIFPTPLEGNLFANPDIPFGTVSGDYKYQSFISRAYHYVRGLNTIRIQSLPEYTDLPLDTRLYVEDIDSFRKVRDINPSLVLEFLKNGYFDKSEDFIQSALERILDVSFHKKDWGGEQNDLYTANTRINGARYSTAFLLKGNGLKVKEMQIKPCGSNGDQILRLCNSPANLLIVQYVGNISETSIADIDGKVRQLRVDGKDSWYCIMDGQDTARVLRAYGEI